MPELPEVETMVRGIRPHADGREIVDVVRPRCTRRPIAIAPAFRTLRARMVGRTITAVERVAKRIVLKLSSGDVLAIEPRMTGLMLLSDPPSTEHLRLEWRLAGAGGERSIWFWDRRGLGTVRLYRDDEFATQLGGLVEADALTLTGDGWQRVCAATRRPIKVALLDQKLVAGIGNLYASEILHVAKISPMLPAAELSAAQVRRLHAATMAVLETAIHYEGSTLGDGTYRNALNKEGGYQNEHRVYAKSGNACARCRRGVIVRIVQAQRSTFYCPRCQK
ncbi:MAG: bifunctional DNA-formamidopyrimidine glycosylase/DNA-(apurinic or apyrimidinic site) lyase [Planctomycetaceae bacterium]|nr:bifunctional DNA-formamidopyrimidine glycosylase/DNA-(apurinic or apyrimidinic site) lyase [Planctomycetaceae bacterium]